MRIEFARASILTILVYIGWEARAHVRKVEAERAKQEQDRKEKEMRLEMERKNLANTFVWERRNKHGESFKHPM